MNIVEFDRPLLGAAVVTYNGWPMVRGAIDDLLAQTRSPDILLVVDNGSTDDTVAQLTATYPAIRVVSETPNRGYGAGLNAGLDALLREGAEYCLLLAQDCLLEPGAVEHLENALQADHSLAAVGPVVGYRKSPDRILSAGGLVVGRRQHMVHRSGGQSLVDQAAGEVLECDWLDGSIMLIAASAVGDDRFEERYYLYFEEVDFQRGLAARGSRFACVTSARSWQTPGRGNPFLETRNRLLFLERRGSRTAVFEELVRQVWLAALDCSNGADGRAHGRRRLQGTFAYLLRRFGGHA